MNKTSGLIMNNHLLFKSLKIISLFLAMIVFFLLVKYLFLLLYPFILGFTIAAILHPSVSWMQKKLRIPRLAATIFLVIICFTLLFAFLFIFISELIHGIIYLSNHLPLYISEFASIIGQFVQDKIQPFYERMIDFIDKSSFFSGSLSSSAIDQLVNQLSEILSHFIKGFLHVIQTFFLQIPESIFLIVLISMITIIFIYDFPHFIQVLEAKFPIKLRKKVNQLWKEITFLFGKYIKAQFILALFTICLCFFGLLMIQVQPALTIALFVGLIDLLPFVGASFIFLPWIIYLFLSANYVLTIKLSLLFISIIIARQVLEPKVLSNAFEIRPIYVLLIMFLTYKIWGIVGILITPIVIVIIIACHRVGVYRFILNFIKE